MITRASKFFFGIGAAGYAMAVLYGVITNGLDAGGVVTLLKGDGAVDAILGPLTFGYKGGVGDHIGYILLMGFAGSNLFMGAVTSAFRDGDPEALAELADGEEIPAVVQPMDLSPWPVVMAFGAATATIGLASSPVMFAAGLIIIGLAGVEWAVKDWSERATGDPEVNRTIRNRIMLPWELPVGGVLLTGTLVYCFSRIFLTASKNGAIIIASLLGLLVFGVAVAMSFAPKMRRGMIVSVLVVGALTALGLGVFGAVRGEREFEEHGHEEASAVPIAELLGVQQ